MTGPGHILIVDDDAAFVRIYREIFEQEGLQVTTAQSTAEAITALETYGAEFDVVLLDQKLQGPGGPDSGLDLIVDVGRLAPFAKTIVVTGYATPSAIERAFELGVYDYLVKNGAFEALLRAKVRNAIEVTSAQRQAALKESDVIGELRAMWAQVRTERNRNRKGKLLEELIKLLFLATPGFGRVTTRLDNRIEEIDVKVDNLSDDPTWRDEGAYLLGECKNWSSRCGTSEVRNFRGKLTAKYNRVRTGFLFAPGGFTKEVHEDVRSHKEGAILIILVDAPDLERWIAADDRLAVLRELHERAVFDLKRGS
jgi:ActR/RegA family two-component response regulator